MMHQRYYTPTAAPPFQTPPLEFLQHPQVPYVQPATHPTHQATYVGAPVSVSSSCSQAVRAHHQHGYLAHFSGSEHGASASLSSEGAMTMPMPCTWQEQPSTCCSSPPSLAYPPGFEPKLGIPGCATTNADTGNTTVSNQHLHPQPYLRTQTQTQTQPQPCMYDQSSQPELQLQPDGHSHSHSHSHSHLQSYPHAHAHRHSYPKVHAHFDLQHQHQHQLQAQQMQPPHPHPYQHQSSQMVYSVLQSTCETPMQHSASQVSQLSMFQNYNGSGAVLGVPVMGAPIYLDTNNMAPPPEILHYQQPVQSLQSEPSHPRQQSHKNIFHLTKYFQKSVSNFENQTQGRSQQCGWQSSNCQANCGEFGRKVSRGNMGQTYVPNASKSSFPKLDQQQLAPTYRNGGESHHLQQRDSLHGSSAYVDEKHNHSQSTQIPKAALVEEFCMPDSYRHDHIVERSDHRSHELKPHEAASLASACSEVQLNFLVECKQEGLSLEPPGETATECNLKSADSQSTARQSTKTEDGVSRWLEQRKSKYPTPANMHRKAEERRKQEEIGECVSQKERNHLRHVRGAISARYHRRRNHWLEKQNFFKEQRIDKSQVGMADGKDNLSNDPDQCANVLEMPMEIEDSGPADSPYQGQASDFEKGEEENAQSTSKSAEITEQVDRKETDAPCFAFVFRRKRRQQKREQSASIAQRQRKRLFQLLDRDLQKENILILQCCRYIVKNHFLQGFDHTNPSRVGKEKPSDACSSHTEEMDTSDSLTMASSEKLIQDLSADNHHVGENQHFKNWDGKVLVLEGADGCPNVSSRQEVHCSIRVPEEEICGNKVQEPFEDGNQELELNEDGHGPTMPAEIFGCRNKEQELIEDGRKQLELNEDGDGTTMPAENFSNHKAYCSEVMPAQGIDLFSKRKELIEEAHVSTMPRDELESNQERLADESLTKSSGQLCREKDVSGNIVGEVHCEPIMASHKHSLVDGYACGLEPSLVEPSQYPWRHSESCHSKSIEGGLAAGHYDCFKGSLITSSMDTDTKQLAMVSSNSTFDPQGLVASSFWNQPNSGSCVPGMDTSDLEIGYCDSFLDDDDDILQYMNFDAFDTDSGICYG